MYISRNVTFGRLHPTTRPESETRCLHFPPSPREKTREKAAAVIERFRTLRAFIRCGFSPRRRRNLRRVARPYAGLFALRRRPLACRQLDRAIEHAKDAVADNPKWSQTHLLLAQAYFARVVAPERTVKALNAEEKEETLAKLLSLASDAILAAEAECLNLLQKMATSIRRLRGRCIIERAARTGNAAT